MADRLAIGQMGSPNISDFISLITDNTDHIYTVVPNATVNLNQSYSTYLVWWVFAYANMYTASGFSVVKAGVKVYWYSSSYAISFNATSIQSHNQSNWATVIGIV